MDLEWIGIPGPRDFLRSLRSLRPRCALAFTGKTSYVLIHSPLELRNITHINPDKLDNGTEPSHNEDPEGSGTP